MKRDFFPKTLAALAILAAAALLLSACAATSHKTREEVKPIVLETPADPQHAAYLGIAPGRRYFKLTEIKTRVLIAEVFQSRCPHCRGLVPDLKRFYHLVDRSGLSGKIKFVGFGYGERGDDIDEFGLRYAIPWPLFPDPGGHKIKVEEIPVTFILEMKPGGDRVIYEFHGPLPKPEDLLEMISKAVDLR